MQGLLSSELLNNSSLFGITNMNNVKNYSFLKTLSISGVSVQYSTKTNVYGKLNSSPYTFKKYDTLGNLLLSSVVSTDVNESIVAIKYGKIVTFNASTYVFRVFDENFNLLITLPYMGTYLLGIVLTPNYICTVIFNNTSSKYIFKYDYSANLIYSKSTTAPFTSNTFALIKNTNDAIDYVWANGYFYIVDETLADPLIRITGNLINELL